MSGAAWLLTLSLVTSTFAWAAEPPKAPPAKGEAETDESETAVTPLDVSTMPFSQDSIRKVVTHHQPQIQACYEEMLAGRSKVVEGTIQTSWVITPEGLVKKAKIEKKKTTLKDAKLHECVVTVLSALTFPKPNDNRDHPIASYPFNLKAVR